MPHPPLRCHTLPSVVWSSHSVATAVWCLLALCGPSAAQTVAPIPADGWSGQVQCVLSVRAAGYQDDQTHTWVVNGAAMVRSGFRDYPATWTVTGGGSRTAVSLRGAGAGPGDTWTRNGAADGTITIFVPVGTDTLRVAAGQRPLKAGGALRGTAAGAPMTFDVDEWRFDYIDIPGGATQTSLVGARPATRTYLAGWRQPPGAAVSENCSWNLTKSGGQTNISGRGQVPSTISAAVPNPSTALPSGTGAPSGGRASVAGRVGSGAPPVPTAIGIVAPLATVVALPDLAASLVGADAGASTVVSWPANAYVRYVADVKNQGLGSADGALITIPRSTGVTKTAVTCVAAGGAQCPLNVNVYEAEAGITIAAFPSGGSVQFAIAATVTGSVGSETSMSVTAVKGTDANTANNAATRTYPVVASSAAAGGSRHFTESGSFTIPPAVTSVVVEVWGAGAGGATGQSNTCSLTSCSGGNGGVGGGSGAYARVQVAVTPGATLDVAIGAGGFPGADGGTTRVRMGGIPIASASGGQKNGQGGSVWEGVTGQAGLNGQFGSSGSLPEPRHHVGGVGGRGGDTVGGSNTPLAAMGGTGGTGVSYQCSGANFGTAPCSQSPPASTGSAGGSGFVRVTW